jgi:hypothetical protein
MKGATQHYAQKVSMFIVNENSEILLHQKTEATSPSSLWCVPYFEYQSHLDLCQAAQQHLESLDLQGELHTAYGADATPMIIALVRTSIKPTLPAEYRWASIRCAISDVRERPAHYTSWFRSSFEGVILYLKTQLKDHVASHDIAHFEL